ncbi:zinc finger protein 432-like [Teleopsis dalmanni]|uniref:zinc finger protein 432-like n=1 Tax=Teleopsis dalmanni TaxID=139649 RepID=UPI000D32B90D|nr:zinc finger protein 432-like [Teleopsis dalmanni]
MRVSCSICNTTWAAENIKMYHVPKKRHKRELWNIACGMLLKDTSRICEKHFRKDDFKQNAGRKRLKPAVVPTLNLDRVSIGKPGIAPKRLTSDCTTTLDTKKLHHKETEDLIDFINEEQFDNKILYDNIEKLLDKDDDSYLCGMIKATKNNEVYSIYCYKCSNVFSLENWEKFANHVRDQHRNRTNSITEIIVEEKLETSHSDVYVADERHELGIEAIINHEINLNYTFEENECEQYLENFSEESSNEGIEREEELSILKPTNQILFTTTDKHIVLDFLDMLKSFPALWLARHNSKTAYDLAVDALTAALNKKWQLTMSTQSMHKSLCRIRKWYRRTCCTANKNTIHKKYQEYFEKCSEFLPNDENEIAVSRRLCDICERCFRDENQLQLHQTRSHKLSDFPYRCSDCSWRFLNVEKLNAHNCVSKSIYVESDSQHEVCEICGKQFPTLTRYKMHKVLHEPPKYKCNNCAKTFFRKSHLTEHIKVHSNERNHVCEQCGKVFLRRKHLMEHRNGVHYEKIVCKICGCKFNDFSSLQGHRKRFHIVLEGTLEELEMKTKMKYNKHSFIIDEKTNKKRLVCDICGNTYSRHAGLRIHKIKAHNYVPPRLHRKRGQKMHQLEMLSDDTENISIEVNYDSVVEEIELKEEEICEEYGAEFIIECEEL